jgi:hypothetical protein
VWHEFFAASAVASAAILGLLFVAMALHVREIEKSPVLQLRTRVNLQALAALVVASLVVLLPGQALWVLGAELMAILVVYLLLVVSGAIRLSRELHGIPRASIRRLVTQNTLLLFLFAAAVSLIVGSGPGLYLVAPVVLLALPVTIYNTWNTLFAPEAAHD